MEKWSGLEINIRYQWPLLEWEPEVTETFFTTLLLLLAKTEHAIFVINSKTILRPSLIVINNEHIIKGMLRRSR